MRQKYLEERFPRWFVFGEGIKNREVVDVSNGNGDVVTGVDPTEAKAMIDERDRLLDRMWELCVALDALGGDSYSIAIEGSKAVSS